MNCDDFLPAMETGGFFRRWLARQHLRRCPNCAAAWKTLAELKTELTSVPSLPPHLRQRWIAAARGKPSPVQPSLAIELAPRMPGNRLLLIRYAAVAAIVLLALLPAVAFRLHWWKLEENVALHNTPSPGPGQHEQRTTSVITVAQIDRPAELTDLETQIVVLQGEVQSLMRTADRLATQQRLSQVLARYSQW